MSGRGPLFMLNAPAQVGVAEVCTTPPLWDLGGRWRGWRQNRISLSEAERTFREQLRLPTDRAVVLTGHQAIIWHPGILAKYIAAEQIASASGAAAAWLVVDHDVYDPDAVTAPVVTADDRLLRSAHRFGESPKEERIAGRREAFAPASATPGAGRDWALACVSRGMAAIEAALTAAAQAGDAVEQVMQAIESLMHAWVSPAVRFDSLCLSQTTAFAQLVRRLRQDPRAAADSYNRAVASRQGHGMTPLFVADDSTRIELPLWRIDEAGRRRRAVAADLEACEPADLAPRALLMTGLVRWLGCDLFIHGTGGAAYDRVTDAWFAEWLGLEPAADLAPDLLVTATLRLPFDRAIVTDADVERARRHHRQMLHDPAQLNEPLLGRRKTDLVEKIAAAPRRSAERARLFREMHALLAEARQAHADDLAAARARIASLARRVDEGALIAERAWPFPLYPQEALDDLAADLSRRWDGQ